MINANQFSEFVVKPTLERIGYYSKEAHCLILGTAIQESGLHFIKQLQGGPALGFYQMEPETHDDIWDNFLKYRKDLSEKVLTFASSSELTQQLISNLEYATVMCRLHYIRVPESIPKSSCGMARYWKKYYNTEMGKGDFKEAKPKFENACRIVEKGFYL